MKIFSSSQFYQEKRISESYFAALKPVITAHLSKFQSLNLEFEKCNIAITAFMGEKVS